MLVLLIISYACYSFGLVLLACELSQRVTLAFDEISDITDQLDWYLFPNELQRILPIFLIGVQEPVNFYCFASITCSRATFKSVSSICFYIVNRDVFFCILFEIIYRFSEFQVVNNGYSYFMVLRHFGKWSVLKWKESRWLHENKFAIIMTWIIYSVLFIHSFT